MVLLEVNLNVHRVLIGGVDESCSESFFATLELWIYVY
jgi:hypothetical protein